MTFLEMCQALRQESGISGVGPTTTVGQTGQSAKIVTWIIDAWTDFQSARPDWKFMWAQFEFDTTAAKRDYSEGDVSISDLELWDFKSFLLYEAAKGLTDQNAIEFTPYRDFRPELVPRMTTRADARPVEFTQLPDGKLRFEPAPDDVYTINGDYKRDLQTFSDNADTPTGLPVRFHKMIVWYALAKYAAHENAPEALTRSQMELEHWEPLLEMDQLPDLVIDTDPIATGDLTYSGGWAWW